MKERYHTRHLQVLASGYLLVYLFYVAVITLLLVAVIRTAEQPQKLQTLPDPNYVAKVELTSKEELKHSVTTWQKWERRFHTGESFCCHL